MKAGICGLCKKSGIIKKSHLLPKSAYKQVRDHPSEGGGSPMIVDMARNKFGKTDKQVDAHFLCGNCESVFSKFGEAPVSKIWATHFDFPMLDILNKITPISISTKRKLYKSDQLDGDLARALYYFAVSVVWRAIEWPRTNVGVVSCKGVLNVDQMREVTQFLLGNISVVDDLFIVLDVNTCSEMTGMLSMPARFAADLESLLFDVLGLRFMVFVGPGFPLEIETLRTTYDRNLLVTSSDHSESRFAMQIAKYLNENNIQ
ncbi:hypothetical protein [Pseudomonas sp. FP1742]|uniref:hypothetical protein n=1 Tax=Pseudomonas sp. FP1742 TaxID=2954079 RepID=UPI002734C2DC|nr:hypothetical protein [Pseudomonas sp. FP1742]WLG49089.1 hypothetical protein PSH64_20435 [Pseudomonas sp. FP1742]